MTSGTTNITVGDNPGGRELVTVTPLSGSGTTRPVPGGIAMAGGGVLSLTRATATHARGWAGRQQGEEKGKGQQ